MTDTAPTGESTIMGHPRGLMTLFFTEMWERLSFYGMRALLVLFMVAATSTGGMGLDDKTATAIYGLYTAAVYLTSLPGGWIADRLIGQQRSIWYGGLIIALGHFTLAIPSRGTFFLGLVFIVLGTGLLKPNASALVGELYPEGGSRRDAGFSLYYMGINLGGFLGPLICGYLGQKINWHYGFVAAGVGMVFGLIQYRLTLRNLGGAGTHALPAYDDPARQHRFLKRSWSALWIGVAVIVVVVGLGYSGAVVYAPVPLALWSGIVILLLGLGFLLWLFFFGRLSAVEKKRLAALTILFLVQALFWAGYEQAGSNFNLFAERYTDLHVFGYAFPASWFQSENSLLILLLAPFFAWFWVWLGRRKLDPSTPMKFALGMVFIGIGFLVMMGAAWIVVAGHKALPMWLTLTYLLHTIGELCLSPVGLSATTKLSPKRYASRLMGTWFLFMALGELLAGLIAGRFSAHDVGEMPRIYLTIAAISIGVGVVLALFSRLIKRRLIGEDMQITSDGH
ncbi:MULTISPECIES: peptide MFS transporter [Oleiagrimonas]|uniref:Peptide MFS transporter n=1 Tax=Oleiagrimonas citrea TaxID=1665687 RepID=A0A846ZLM4_9GAMM|nr:MULTISPECIES: peptide MFS transporter [Oleiagrimonas]NKZ39104.1 peptide MFS transporter [Oleiagrimonas citrea]RAP57710.1 MFS transporter [Oleiagrimonas sp. MCCC 1A03011]